MHLGEGAQGLLSLTYLSKNRSEYPLIVVIKRCQLDTGQSCRSRDTNIRAVCLYSSCSSSAPWASRPWPAKSGGHNTGKYLHNDRKYLQMLRVLQEETCYKNSDGH